MGGQSTASLKVPTTGWCLRAPTLAITLFPTGTQTTQFMDATAMITMATDSVLSSPGAAGGRGEVVVVAAEDSEAGMEEEEEAAVEVAAASVLQGADTGLHPGAPNTESLSPVRGRKNPTFVRTLRFTLS